MGKEGDISDPDQNHNKIPATNIEKLQQTSVLIGQVLSGVTHYKKGELEFQLKVFCEPIETFRLMIIGAMSACQRYKLIVRYNHMKKLEIQKV